MTVLRSRCGHYIFALSFLSIYFFLSSPNLSRRRLDLCHAAPWKYRTQKSPFGHHRTILSGYIFATKARVDNRKNLLSSNISSICPHNMLNFGLLAAEIISSVWGTPENFNGFRVLAVLLHGTPVLGVSHTLRRWTEGATLYSAGRPSRWALAHISNSTYLPGTRRTRRVLIYQCW